MDRDRRRLPGGFDEHDLTRARFAAEDTFKKHKRKIGCGCLLVALIAFLLLVLSIVAPLLMGGSGGEIDYDDMGRPDAIERYAG